MQQFLFVLLLAAGATAPGVQNKVKGSDKIQFKGTLLCKFLTNLHEFSFDITLYPQFVEHIQYGTTNKISIAICYQSLLEKMNSQVNVDEVEMQEIKFTEINVTRDGTAPDTNIPLIELPRLVAFDTYYFPISEDQKYNEIEELDSTGGIDDSRYANTTSYLTRQGSVATRHLEFELMHARKYEISMPANSEHEKLEVNTAKIKGPHVVFEINFKQ